MTVEEQIKALCYSPKVPDHVKRHFSADCAEKAMFAWCEQNGKEPIPQWWVLMEAIRNFAEGRITLEALGEARKPYVADDWGIDWAAYSAAYWATDNNASRAAYWVASRSTYSAANGAASRSASRAAEREWQLCYFHELIAEHNAIRSQLIGLFNRRATEIEQTLPKAQQQYEEVLFA